MGSFFQNEFDSLGTMGSFCKKAVLNHRWTRIDTDKGQDQGFLIRRRAKRYGGQAAEYAKYADGKSRG